MASACTAKRPPKLRAACNECHAAKVRCSGEKSGCQRCANLGLVCIFSISRIGKVPGKRSKANRLAAAAAALAASSSSSTLDSASSTSLPSPTNLIPPNQALNLFRPQHPEDEPASRPPPPPQATVLTGIPRDPSSMITPVHDYTSNIPFYAGDVHPGEPLPLPDVLPSNAPHIFPTNVDLGQPDLSYFSWTADLDPLSACGLPTPGLEMPSVAKAPLSMIDRQINPVQVQSLTHTQTQDWDLESGSNTSSVDPRRTSITSIRAPITPPEFNILDDAVPSTGPPSLRPLDLLSCSTYLQLLHDIEQTATPGQTHTVDSVLAANQRYLSTLLRMTETPGFECCYDTHMLFTVALNKVIGLFTVAYRDLVIRMEGPEPCNPNYISSHSTNNNNLCGNNSVDRLIRFGVFEIDLVEQKAICRTLLLRELKRARLCLIRLVNILERDNLPSGGGAGRHEGLCEEMSRRLDLLVGSLEGGDL